MFLNKISFYLMEFLEEHDDLRRKDDSNMKKEKQKHKNSVTYKDVELTPNANRKNSDFIIQEIKNNFSNIEKNNNNKIKLIAICGGQSSGKSMISLYFKNRLKHAKILCEKEFFIGQKERKKSVSGSDVKSKIINSEDDGYPESRKTRLIETNSIKCFDFNALKNALYDFVSGKKVSVQGWDKENNTV